MRLQPAHEACGNVTIVLVWVRQVDTPEWTKWTRARSELREDDPLLRLVLPFAIGVAHFAGLIRLEEQDLAQAFVGVDTRGQWRGVRDFERDKAFPLRLKRRDVHNDAAARVG